MGERVNSFSENLLDLIIEKNVSLREVERKTGVASSQISRYIKNTIPSIDVAVRLASYFDCSLDYLFGLIDDHTNKFKTSKYDLSDFVKKYVLLLEKNKTTNYKTAKANGFSESCMRRWKSNNQLPRLDIVAKIAQSLGSSIDWLVGRE